MPETKTHTGGCHCGRVRYEVTTDLATVTECNCSICGRLGTLMTFVPGAQFKLLAGEGEYSTYRFGKERITRAFCRTCGVHAFATGKNRDGQELAAVNVRCLDDVDVWSLTPRRIDGKSI